MYPNSIFSKQKNQPNPVDRQKQQKSEQKLIKQIERKQGKESTNLRNDFFKKIYKWDTYSLLPN